MDTNVHDESTEYTEETEASQTSAIVLRRLVTKVNLEKKGIWLASVCSAVSMRFARGGAEIQDIG